MTHPIARLGACVLAAFALLAASGCTPKRIPGTDIEDTPESRAILEVMEKYRRAVEARDASGVLALVADSFKDDGGTPSPEDDLDYQGLTERLPQAMARLEDVRLEMTVRKVEIDKSAGTARAVYTYTTSFRMPGLTTRPQSESEIKEMFFKRVGEQWKITSGI